jgi:hypothetical protein
MLMPRPNCLRDWRYSTETIDDAKALYDNKCQVTAVPPPSPAIDIVPLPSSKQISVSWDPYEMITAIRLLDIRSQGIYNLSQ